MASRGSLHGGKYGRVQAVITVALDDYSEFDTWCLIHGFDPLEVPAYRFYNAALAWLRDGFQDPEELIKFNSSLRDADSIPHPFLSHLDFELETVTTTTTTTRRTQRELSLEEQKRRDFAERAKRAQEDGVHGEAALATKFRVPDWWLGEEDAYKSSKTAQMGTSTLPKFG